MDRMDGMDGIKREFIAETQEGMDRFDQILLAMEKNPLTSEAVSEIFRVVHSIKGACGTLGFAKLESLAHSGENLLSVMREGKLAPGKDVVTCLFRMSDAIRRIIRSVESGDSEGDMDPEPVIKELAAFQPDWVGDARSPLADDVPLADAAANAPPVPEESASPKEPHAALDRTIRVDVSLLDKLMNLVGELVLVRNQVLRHTQLSGNSPLTIPSQHLNLITSQLQEGVMKTRMQPIKNVWGKFPRIVRDLCNSCGKLVQVEMVGEDTELDKTILEAIKDPLTHVLRNSVDHGIEEPDVRESWGKPREGRISLKAYHEGGQVIIEVSDDGAGINSRRVAEKALEKGLVKPEKLATMPEWELAQLIFLPGFSTAEKITTLSGRGVGMDVVKTHIEKIGGTVELFNRPGLGLTLRIKIPLTLAIIPALIVETLSRRFAIPQLNVLEVVRLKNTARDKGVEWFQETPVYRLRGRLLPLARLDRLFEKAETDGKAAPPPIGDNFIVVLHAENHQFGILVHSVQDTQEIVVKPLSKHLKSSLFAGATIMGDGKVALIMDVPGLAQNARLTRGIEEANHRESAPGSADQGWTKESMLIVACETHGLMAVPVANISRLQEFPADAVERMANMEVFQSRGRILPILRLAQLLGPGGAVQTGETAPALRKKRSLSVLVFTEGERSAGFVVDRIMDIVDVASDIHLPAGRPGFKGSTLIRGKATEILDLPALARMAIPALFSGREISKAGG